VQRPPKPHHHQTPYISKEDATHGHNEYWPSANSIMRSVLTSSIRKTGCLHPKGALSDMYRTLLTYLLTTHKELPSTKLQDPISPIPASLSHKRAYVVKRPEHATPQTKYSILPGPPPLYTTPHQFALPTQHGPPLAIHYSNGDRLCPHKGG